MLTLSKSQFKSQMLEYLRKVEQEGKLIIITHDGKPVAKVLPFTEEPDHVLASLHGSVLVYKDPFSPVGDAWEAQL